MSDANANGPPTWANQLHAQSYGISDGGDVGGGPAETFDPGDHTVDEVKTYVEANPDQRSTVLSAEKRGKNRTTLVDWLSGTGG